jgi:branched-chain amino acid transport system permease protein
VLPYSVGPFVLGTATLALIMALFALSINLIAGYGGLLSMGQAGIMACSAYGVAYAATHGVTSHLTQIVIGMVAAIMISVLFALMAMRTNAVYFLMVTLAQGMIIWGLAHSLEPITGSENGIKGVYRPSWVGEDWQFYYLCLLVLLVCAAAIWVIIRSPFGWALRGLQESHTRVRMLGYDPTFHKFAGIMLSGFFAGVAGILFAYNNEYVSPTVAAFATSADGLLMVILGGIGTMSGPVVGAFIIVFAQNWLSIYAERWITIEGIIFVVMVLFASEGLVGGLSTLWNRVMGDRRASGRTGTGDSAAEATLALASHGPGAEDGDADD